MEMHIFGVLYTVLFVILCVMFIGTFSEKRDLSGKWCRYAVIGAMILADYFISVKLDGDIILKEIAIIVTGTLFMCLCFRQRWIKTAIFVLLYQGICFVTDYISIIMLSKCFPTITMERFIGTTDKCNARNFKPDAAGLFYYGAAKICCKKILGNAYHIRMGEIYDFPGLHNYCPDCTSDKF